MALRTATRKKTAKKPPNRAAKKPPNKTAKKPPKAAPRKPAAAPVAEFQFSYGGLLRKRPPPTAEQLAIVESRVGASLPQDYKAFLA